MDLKQISQLKTRAMRFFIMYKFAIDEVSTKIDILRQEFQYIYGYNPIERVTSRVKTPQSILNKVRRKGIEISLPSIKENVRDIAGIRIVCSFISDIYKIKDTLENQADLEVVECKDYIKNPKENGYRSLHLIVKVPVITSDREEKVYVEIQLRTIAMDFWANLEHKLYYKYNYEVPERLLNELKEAADLAAELDQKMEKINCEINHYKEVSVKANGKAEEFFINSQRFILSLDFLKLMLKTDETHD
ncbi:MAG: GTP pyrophosphokinase family protein [Firmicutes bacterium]|nr:GTP pyrophosphokinase family protein [Bacillota bacterium]